MNTVLTYEMVDVAREFDLLRPARVPYALAAHRALPRPRHRGVLLATNFLDVKHPHRAPLHQRGCILANNILLEVDHR